MKKLLALLLALAMVFALTACGQRTETPAGNPTYESTEGSSAALKTFTVTVVHADGTNKDFTYETDEEFVGTVLQAEGLIQGEMGPYGLEIHTVDGEKAVYAEDKAYWAIYEGEEYAMQGIDTTPVVDGRVYKLVYTGA